MTNKKEITKDNTFQGICEACGKYDSNGVVVSSAFGPVSYLYCQDCLAQGKESYSAMVEYIAATGHFPDEINEEYQAEVRRQLELHQISETQFISDVEKIIELLNEAN